MALAYLTINLDAFTGDDHPPVPSYSTITLDPGADHIDAANDVIHVRTIVVSLDRQGKAASANGVPCVDGKVPVVAGVMYAVSAPNVLRDGPHYIPALTAGQVVDLSDYITPGAPLTPDQAATLTARIVALEETPPGSGGAVDSVNGRVGVVVLDAADVGAATAAQGALADTAVQPADLSAYATNPGTARIASKLRRGQAVTVAFLGDSGFEGTTASAPGTNDAASLVCSDLATTYGATVTKHNLAVSGYRAYSLLNPGEATPTKFGTALGLRADLYVISFGHNDIRSDDPSPTYQPLTGYPRSASIATLEHIIRRIRVEAPGADIAVSNEWPYTGGASASNAMLSSYSESLRELAASYGCAFVDFAAALNVLGVDGATPSVDDIYIHAVGQVGAQHPTNAGHRIWADEILATIAAGAAAASPTKGIPVRPIFGAERHTHVGVVAMPAAGGRSYGSDGYRLIGTWNGATTLPQTSSTAAEQIDIQFIGTECFLRLDTGAGHGRVKINVDGVNLNADLNLAAFGTGQARIPITGLAPGSHRILVTLLSGAVTFRGCEYLPAVVRTIPHGSALITYTGAGWSTAGADANFYVSGRRSSTTNGDSYTVTFIGTALAANGQHYGATVYLVKVQIDGGTENSQDWATGGDGTVPATMRTIVSGLPYGQHTVKVTLNQTGRTLTLGALFAYDETRTERPTTLDGLTVAGETVAHPQALPTTPAPTITPADATSALPPYPATNTATSLVVQGTAASRHSYRLETGRLAW